ncbi:hypothetical protein EYF80_060445 [Liparis tanakae]|uniref:Uncharacterized protein n=1 Tax=Liparis tanakae TaxID=230148 RepID=A0A4Z2EKK8_9TELE|nr:hypothetical protein EYF80_060445 [Liparis tanakae]
MNDKPAQGLRFDHDLGVKDGSSDLRAFGTDTCGDHVVWLRSIGCPSTPMSCCGKKDLKVNV